MWILYALGFLDRCFSTSAADTKTIRYPQSSEEASTAYPEIMQEVLDKLGSNETCAYNVLVFYPGEKCVEYAVGKKMIRNSGYENVIVYAAKYNPVGLDYQSIAVEWELILKNKEDLIERLYDEVAWRSGVWDADDYGLCGNLGLRWVGTRLSHAIIQLLDTAAVVQCPRRFVWYELGWRYYEAYVTSSKYVLRFSPSSPWDNNCGAIVFFP